MKRILIAVGTLAAVLVLGVGAVSIVTDGEGATPEATPTDASKPLSRDALTEQADRQAQQEQAAADDLARRVGEEADRLVQTQ